MKPEKSITDYWLLLAGFAILAFFVSGSWIREICSDPYGRDYDSNLTAVLISVILTAGFTLLVLVANRRILTHLLDKFERMLVLIASAFFLGWIAYVILDANICWAVSLRRYLVILLLPLSLLALVGAGQRWLADD